MNNQHFQWFSDAALSMAAARRELNERRLAENEKINMKRKEKRAARAVREKQKKKEKEQLEEAEMKLSIPGTQSEALHVTRTGTRHIASTRRHAAPLAYQQHTASPVASTQQYPYPAPPLASTPRTAPPYMEQPTDGYMAPTTPEYMAPMTPEYMAQTTHGYTAPTHVTQMAPSGYMAQPAYEPLAVTMPSVAASQPQVDQFSLDPALFSFTSSPYFTDQSEFSNMKPSSAPTQWENLGTGNWDLAPDMNMNMLGAPAMNNSNYNSNNNNNNNNNTNVTLNYNNCNFMSERASPAYDEGLDYVNGEMPDMDNINDQFTSNGCV